MNITTIHSPQELEDPMPTTSQTESGLDQEILHLDEGVNHENNDPKTGSIPQQVPYHISQCLGLTYHSPGTGE